MKIIERNHSKCLDILLEDDVEFPVNEYIGGVLDNICENKTIMLKTFNHLTDVLNNPEDVITSDIGNSLTNSIMFIGYIFDKHSDKVSNFIKKVFF